MTAVSWRTASASSAPVGGRAGDVEVDRPAELHERGGAEGDLVGEGEADGHDGQPLGAGRPGAERDAGGAGLDRVDPRSIVRRALGEDRDDVALGQRAVALGEGVLVPDGAALVDLPAHEHHAERCRSSSPPTGTFRRPALAMNRGVRPSAAVISDGVDEAVEVVGHQQHRSSRRVPLLAGHLEPPEEQRGGEAPDPRHQPSHGAASMRASLAATGPRRRVSVGQVVRCGDG